MQLLPKKNCLLEFADFEKKNVDGESCDRYQSYSKDFKL